MNFRTIPLIALLFLLQPAIQQSASAQQPTVKDSVVFAEKDGHLAVEAEHFFKQTKSDIRAFHLTHSKLTPAIKPDGDPPHVGGASGGAYLEILPDTRRTHADKLTSGINFSNTPGKMAILHYNVNISTPGKYYVWVRAHSTGGEDNGLHVGIDGTWPDSGQRLQWCKGKKTWHWESNQRTEKVHCGEPHKIFLDIKSAGDHVIHFSMREDGFEFDKWLITTDRNFARPNAVGPDSLVKTGTLPAPFPFVKAPATTTAMTPEPDTISTSKSTAKTPTALQMPAAMFADEKTTGYYQDKQWLAVNPDKNKTGIAERTFPYPTGTYNVTLKAVGENDGQSSYKVAVDGKPIGDFTPPLSKEMFEEGNAYNKTWKKIQITEGAIIKVASTIGSADGKEFSRARWRAVAFSAADAATQKQIAPLLKQAAIAQKMAAKDAARSAEKSTKNGGKKNTPKSSPTKPSSSIALQLPRQTAGNGSVKVTGDMQQWHKVTVDLNGPYAHEKDNQPNPFTDYRMTVVFTHADGTTFTIPGYFAADGNAANSSAADGTVWRAHFAAPKTGDWKYKIGFLQGAEVALSSGSGSGTPLAPYDGAAGSISIRPSDKQGRDLRAHGQLKYVGQHYLQFAGSKKYFLKVGADAPETLLAYADFDNTIAGNARKAPIKTWSPHLKDWKAGDPTWGNGKGKALIGAINYLSGKGCNAYSFLTYNAGGDGDNVWPFIQREDKLHYDCSKLDQWSTVFDHSTASGMYLHFKLQETENDDHKKGKGGGNVPECLDGGHLGPQRKLYCREMIARFGHNLALNWNLGEENTQTRAQQQAMINYIDAVDSYDHNIVIHTYPGSQDSVYKPLLGDNSKLTGVSLQNSSLETTHAETLKWVTASAKAGKPWIVAFDESGSASHAQCPDLGYKGFDGHDKTGKMAYTQHKVRKQTLWGTLMAGGAGNEYYFGYQFVENDIVCEDWRSRDQSWDYCRIAIEFFHNNSVPFWEMKNADQLVGNPQHKPTDFCFAKADDIYLVYLSNGGSKSLDLSATTGDYTVQWFNPRSGGNLQTGSVKSVTAGKSVSLGNAPADAKEDWLVVVKKK